MWLRHKGFEQVVADAWQFSCHGSAIYRLAFKMRALKQRLRHWNTHVFGNI